MRGISDHAEAPVFSDFLSSGFGTSLSLSDLTASVISTTSNFDFLGVLERCFPSAEGLPPLGRWVVVLVESLNDARLHVFCQIAKWCNDDESRMSTIGKRPDAVRINIEIHRATPRVWSSLPLQTHPHTSILTGVFDDGIERYVTSILYMRLDGGVEGKGSSKYVIGLY